MKKLSSTATIVFQLFLTFGVLFLIYMVFAVLDNDEVDMISELGLLTIHPLFAAIFSAITIIVCILLGLPIRLNSKLKKWWTDKPFISIAVGIIGLILLLLSLNQNFTESTKVTLNEEEVIKQIPNTTLALTGWFLTAFSLLHFYPLTILIFIKNKFGRQSKVSS